MFGKIGFARQPVQMMHSQGFDFSADVLGVLRNWRRSIGPDVVRATIGERLFVLSENPSSPVNVVVMVQAKSYANVCALAYGSSEDVVAHYAPLAQAEWLSPAVEVRLDEVEPNFFLLLGETFQPPSRYTSLEEVVNERRPLYDIGAFFDVAARRWQSAQARQNFRALLEDARGQPQIVERGGDDLVVVSRAYLSEMFDPTSAGALSQRYRGRALSADGLPPRASHPLGELRPLPELGEA